MDFHHLGTILIIFDTKFMLSRDQIRVTKHSLEMSKTLARFRDPIMVFPYATDREDMVL